MLNSCIFVINKIITEFGTNKKTFMLLEERYRQILLQLKEGKRPLWKPEEAELAEFEGIWRKSLHLSHAMERNLIPLFCLLSHAQSLTDRFDSLFFQTLTSTLPDSELLIVALGCLHRQVLDRCEQRGERIPAWLVECLGALMAHDNPEVFHWCLRTIERMGSMGIVLREDVLGKCPGWWESLFNSHKRASREIIFLLNGRWKHYGHS